ncbi:conserved hypothetical protein [Cupriavidus phytorum]|uniref:Uncharacterized protein n=1 Tax=Cupriavidus taiwanensis TaxID=164546 RepID=A0A375B9I4_9BURK|nr:conserved hypothetical protein [Cupriavidus taiwanensis]
MDVLLFTNCTNRKRGRLRDERPADWYRAAPAERGTLANLARLWRKELSRLKGRLPANELYVGRSVVDARKTAGLLGATMGFVSAGLGLTYASTLVPCYDLTISPGPTSISPLLTQYGSTPADWWMELNGGPAITRAVSDDRTRAVFLALPSGYLEMVAVDLQHCATRYAEKLRIFTSEKGRNAVPEHLQLCVMPYDDRLEATDLSGTRTDFPQRALRHFVERLNGNGLSLAESVVAVEHAMAGLQARHTPRRTKLSDQEIAQLLRANWSENNGSSSRLLRFLRDQAQVACEQGRFRRIWGELREEISS